MASSSSSKKAKQDDNKKKSNGISTKETRTPIKKQDKKKASATKKPNKSNSKSKAKPKPKPKSKPGNNKNKSCNGTLVESEVIADPSSSTDSKEQQNEKKKNTNKNVTPKKRKQKEKVEENGEEHEADEEAKMCRFPMNRIKRIMKTEDSRIALPQDVVFLVNKATEKFLQKFCEEGYKCAVKDRKKSLSYKHLSMVVCDRKKYDFLSEYVPEKIKAEDALNERNSTEREAGEGTFECIQG